MFDNQRYIVKLQLVNTTDNAAIYATGAKYITDNVWMEMSGVFQEIGLQALFAAATMGMAGALTKLAVVTAAGRTVATLGAEGSFARAAVGVVGQVGGISKGVTGAEAWAGILGRASAGCIMLAVRRLTSDFGMSAPPPGAQAATWRELGASIFLTVLIAWAGSPGAPAATVRPLKSLVDQLPSIGSTQGGAQVSMAMYAGVNAWTKLPESRPLLTFINNNRQVFDQKIEKFANDSAQRIIDWAMAAKQDVAANVEQAARKIDYSQALPFFARHFSIQGNTQELNKMCVQLAVYQVMTDFWVQVNHSLSDLEQGTNGAKQMGK